MTSRTAAKMPRLSRAGAAYVNLAPAIGPLFPLISMGAAGALANLGGFVIMLELLGLGALNGLVVLIANSVLLRRHRQTFGSRYFGFELTGVALSRLLWIDALVGLSPLLIGSAAAWAWAKLPTVDDTFTALLAVLLPLTLWLVNWLPSWGKISRTLVDRLAGIMSTPSGARPLRLRPTWQEVLLLAPPLLLAPLSADMAGGIRGCVAACVFCAIPVVLRRSIPLASDIQAFRAG